MQIIKVIRRFVAKLDQQPGRKLRRGQTLVEYALILAVMSIVAIGVLITLGQQTKSIYTAISSQIARSGS